MTENTYPRDFEIYWESHKADLIRQAPRALKEERENNGKMNTAGDWLLFALPIIVIVGFTNTDFIKSELLRFVVALAIGLVLLCHHGLRQASRQWQEKHCRHRCRHQSLFLRHLQGGTTLKAH